MSGQSAVNPARKLHDAAVVYLYDGSFEGFLCCVFESFAQHEIPFAVWTPERETATLYPFKDIATDHEKARRVFASLGRKLGAETEYLVIHPKNYILPLLRGHFCGRFPEEDFMIYDAVHQAVLLYRDHRPQLLELAEPLELPPPSEREQQFQALWKQFYKTLEIQARHNERGRMTHCPKRFWADLTELREEL